METFKKALGELIHVCKNTDVATHGQFGDDVDKIMDLAVDIIRDAAAGFEIAVEVNLFAFVSTIQDHFLCENTLCGENEKLCNDLKNAVIEVIKAY